jgi:hypothetical protein
MPRKPKKFHFIYKTTNTLTGRYYIGMHSTNDLDDGYLGSGKRLRHSIRKYGEEVHVREILEFCENREELKSREEEIVNLNEIAKEECMNLKVGGYGGLSTEEHRKKFHKMGGKSRSKRLKDDPEFFREQSKIASDTMKKSHKEGKFKYDNFKGKNHSIETKKKMSESSKGTGLGESNSQYGTCWIYNEDLKKSKKIKKDQLGDFVSKGWSKGRKFFKN